MAPFPVIAHVYHMGIAGYIDYFSYEAQLKMI